MSRRAKEQQEAIARLRAKGLTLAQANSFAAKRRRSRPPVAAIMAFAGVVLVGAGGYATTYAGFEDETAAVASPATIAPAPALLPEPTAQPAAVTQDVPAAAQTLAFNTPDTASAVDWERTAYIAFNASDEELQVAEPEDTGPDCVAELRDMAAQTVLFFEPGQVQPIEADVDALLRLDERARSCAQAKIVVEGHSDASGTAAMNLELSWQRADATIALLRAIDVDTSRFESIGYGARLPRAQGDAGDDAINRRVEFDVRRMERE